MLSRIGISLDAELLDQFDELIESKGYVNRSEAMRDLIRELLVKKEWQSAKDDRPRIAVVTLVYNHDKHELSHKLMHIQHETHDVVISTMHVHMDAHNCLEVLILKGQAAEIVRLGNTLISTRGVKMGKLVLATTGEKL